MGISPKLCQRCGSTAASQERFCRRCGAKFRDDSGRGPRPWSLPDLWAAVIHAVGGAVGVITFLWRDPDLHLIGAVIFIIVGASLAFRVRRRSEYPVMKLRRRARRLKNAHVSVVVSAREGIPARGFSVEGTVVFVTETHHDEIIVRTNLPLSTRRPDSSLLSLLPLESGDSFATLLDEGKMRVQILLVDQAYLSLGRGNLFAWRRVARSPPIAFGSGEALVERPKPRQVRRRVLPPREPPNQSGGSPPG